ncbi:MAG: MinD/ParA family protein [Anaerolineales bacterium]
MSKTIGIHSFRRGTGTSVFAMNISALLALEGLRVGLIDTNFRTPGLHILAGMGEDEIEFTLNDYLWGRCGIENTVYEVTSRLDMDIEGQLFLIPASTKTIEVARLFREGYAVETLDKAFRELQETLELSALLIDTPAGLSEETLRSIVLVDSLAIILRPDQQDYQGTAVTVDLTRRLNIPSTLLVVNQVPNFYDFDQVRRRVEETFDCQVAAVLPNVDELAFGDGIFVLSYPNHPLTIDLLRIAVDLLE